LAKVNSHYQVVQRGEWKVIEVSNLTMLWFLCECKKYKRYWTRI